MIKTKDSNDGYKLRILMRDMMKDIDKKWMIDISDV